MKIVRLNFFLPFLLLTPNCSWDVTLAFYIHTNAFDLLRNIEIALSLFAKSFTAVVAAI